nr:bidirectional sugar transporter SWEET16-like [Tanacetum cinerariifolium]
MKPSQRVFVATAHQEKEEKRMFFLCLLDPDDGILIVTVNAADVTMQALYLIILFIYSSKEKRVKYFGFVILDIVFLGMVLAFTLVAFKEGSRRTFTGVLCATFTTMMYVAPLAAPSTTIKTKSGAYANSPSVLPLSQRVNWTPAVMSEMEKQIDRRGIDIQDINFKANIVNSKKRTFSRVDIFPITMSQFFGPNKSDPIQEHEDVAEDSGMN